MTETWLKPNDPDAVMLTPQGYSLLHVPEKTKKKKRGGGVAVIYRNVIDMEQQQMDTYDTFEHLELLLNTNNNCVRVCVIYRPPDTSPTSFLVEF